VRSIFTTAVVVLIAVAAFGTVSVVSPANGSTVTSPTHFVGSASSGYPITAIRIYVDNIAVYTTGSAYLDTYVTMSNGPHYVVVQAWDSSGAVFKSPMNLKVSGTTSGVTVRSPANGASMASPVTITASAYSAKPVTAMRVYVDNVAAYTIAAASVNTALPMAAGAHYIVVQAWDSTGAVFKTAVNVNVAAPASDIPSNATTIYNIEDMAGWEACTTCAGEGGNGTSASYGMTQGIGNPSLDGQSTQFAIGGSVPYSNALWWKQLGANSNARHFVYDLYFYVKTPQYAQALEFDVNQSVGGYKYIFGTECDPRGTGQWAVWDGAATTWRPTGIACRPPSANTWHHLVEEFQRDDDGHVTFVSITLDGVTNYVNRTYGSIPSSVNEINVAFQMDGDYAQHPYGTWLDGVKLTYW
jgi:hypothetical protein